MRTIERLGTTWPELLRFDAFPRLLDITDIRVEEYTEDDGKTLVVAAELPGVDPDKDIQITVTDNLLTLRAERRAEAHDESRGIRHSEFRYGSFERMIALPEGATEQDVKATYKDGILQVRIPVAQPREPERRSIPVVRE